METLEIIKGMDEAIRILKAARLQDLTGGSLTLWRLVDHAEQYLDKQISELLALPVDIDCCMAGAPAVNGCCGDPACVCSPHSKDSDCVLDPESQECIYCHVWHGAPCPDCGQRGYHRNLCRQTRLKGQIHAL